MDIGVHGIACAGEQALQRDHIVAVDAQTVGQHQPALDAAGLGAVAVMVLDAAAPFAAQVGRGQAREKRGVLRGNAGLIVVAVERPGLDLRLGQLPRVQQPVEGVQDVVALGADRRELRFQFLGADGFGSRSKRDLHPVLGDVPAGGGRCARSGLSSSKGRGSCC
jgi:hypothetical protein